MPVSAEQATSGSCGTAPGYVPVVVQQTGGASSKTAPTLTPFHWLLCATDAAPTIVGTQSNPELAERCLLRRDLDKPSALLDSGADGVMACFLLELADNSARVPPPSLSSPTLQCLLHPAQVRWTVTQLLIRSLGRS